tara:strand:- start:257 stop:967 length:711 start_codon:yes stop_codon:yes gene_type:complete
VIDLKINDELNSLVSGKDISIVGPAPYLIGKDRGPEFDSSDIIVRPNEIIPLKKLRKDYGSRTDIYFCNFGDVWMDGIKRKISTDDHDEYFKKLKLVVGSAIRGSHSDNIFASQYKSSVPQNFQNINVHNLPFYWIGNEDYMKLYQLIGAEYNTGIAAISILLNYPIKSLKISGFTFHTGGSSYNELYCDGHMDEIDTRGRSFGHGTGPTIGYMRKLVEVYGDKLTLDDELINIIS